MSFDPTEAERAEAYVSKRPSRDPAQRASITLNSVRSDHAPMNGYVRDVASFHSEPADTVRARERIVHPESTLPGGAMLVSTYPGLNTTVNTVYEESRTARRKEGVKSPNLQPVRTVKNERSRAMRK